MFDDSSFFGGMDLFDGMPLRRAGTILFAIEGRTAQLVAQSRQAANPFLTEITAAEKEQAFLAAIAQGRDLPLQPTIQDIERYAPEWSSLVPSDEAQRAALAKKFAEKYDFPHQKVPAMRLSLGLDVDGVSQAFERLFKEPIEVIYSPQISFREQARWLSSKIANKLERLPPFWIAYFLTLTETVGASILALSIALAGIGPLPGVILLLILGLVNILTIMGIVEAITRNGSMRYGTSYFSRLTSDYLGKPGSIILIPAFYTLSVFVLIAFYIGISTTLAEVTGVTSLIWALLIFVSTLYFLRGESLNATIASAFVVGIISVLIIILLILLTLPYVQLENLRYIDLPFGSGQEFDPKILALVFGVVLASYFGHTTAVSASKVVLPRDPGGDSLMWGNILAMATVILLYSSWVIAVNGAIPAVQLSSLTGTVIPTLAELIGGIVPILGTIYVILAMGISIVLFSYAIFFQTREFLPENSERTTRFLFSFTPLFLILLVVQWLLYTGSATFSEVLGFIGLLLLPILGGIFPMLMLAASRRKGEYLPKRTYRLLGNPLVVTVVCLIYLSALFIYGFFIWEDPIPRALAIGSGILVSFVTFLIIQQGALRQRVVIEFRMYLADNNERATLTLVDAGKPLQGSCRLLYADQELSREGKEIEIPLVKQLKSIYLTFHSPEAKEMKIWLHRVTPEGISEPISAGVQLRKVDQDKPIQIDLQTTQVIMPLTTRANELKISFN